jgi:hypothetical protein
MPDSTTMQERPNHDPLPDGAIWTPEIERLGQHVARWIRIDTPGATVFGKMRAGKSAAVQYLRDTLSSLVGYPVEVIIWEIGKEDSDNPRHFLQARMTESGNLAIAHRDVEVLKNRFFQHLVQRCETRGTRRLIVIIDEAQYANDEKMAMLVGFFNRITKEKLKPFFLLIGQPTLGAAIDLNGIARDLNVIGRFRVNQYEFKGISLNQLEDVLREFERPQSDGTPSGLASFLPAAYANGWSLADIAPFFREAVSLVMKQHNVNEEIRIPMQYLRSTIASYVHHVRDSGENPSNSSSALLIRCMRDSGFLSVFTYYVGANTDVQEDNV